MPLLFRKPGSAPGEVLESGEDERLSSGYATDYTLDAAGRPPREFPPLLEILLLTTSWLLQKHALALPFENGNDS